MRAAQFVRALAEELQQVAEKLAQVARGDEVLQAKLINVVPKQYVQVFVLDELEAAAGFAQQPVTIGMEGADLDVRAQDLLNRWKENPTTLPSVPGAPNIEVVAWVPSPEGCHHVLL